MSDAMTDILRLISYVEGAPDEPWPWFVSAAEMRADTEKLKRAENDLNGYFFAGWTTDDVFETLDRVFGINPLRDKPAFSYAEKEGDLFDYTDEYFLAHCISSDFALGAGIAVQFNKRYDMRRKLNEAVGDRKHRWPSCILIDRVFNLVTKERSFHKPSYSTLQSALNQMKQQAVSMGVTKIAMPFIGCGLDGLKWPEVQQMLKDTFGDTDIEILVVYLWRDRYMAAMKPKQSAFPSKEFEPESLSETRQDWFVENFPCDTISPVSEGKDYTEVQVTPCGESERGIRRIYGNARTGFACFAAK